MSLLFNGSYANPDTPLWLSALNPTPGPNNLQVSTLTTNALGGVIMVSDNDPYPGTSGAPVIFNRVTGEAPTALQQAPSKNVPTKSVETTYLASVTNGGTVYDDMAMRGLQIYGPQVVLPSANTGAAGYLTQGPDPFSVKLYTSAFYTDTVNARAGNFSTIGVSSFTFSGTTAFSTINASTVNAGNVTASTLTVSSFSLPNVIQVSTINALQGIFSSITAPNIGGGSISTFSTLTTSTFTASVANISTLNVSSFTLPTNVQFSTLTTSTINANYAKISSIYGVDNNSFISTGYLIAPNVNTYVISTLFMSANDVSTNILQANAAFLSTISTNKISTNTIVANNISTNSLTVSTISTNTVTANVASFSTLNAPGGSVVTSTINTGLLSTTVAVTKALFLSTMVFNATLSPSIDLGLGGVIGGLIGGFGANALSVGLGAAGLATGISALAMSRTSGGTDPSFYQTVNGTSQLQFSTFTSPLTRVFVNTDSVTPRNTPGNIVSVTTTIPAGTLVMRTVSDPLNLPNVSGAVGQGIQGFSQWTQVIPGQTQIGNNRVSSINGNYIDFGSNIPGVNPENDRMYFSVPPGSSGSRGVFDFNNTILGTGIAVGPTYGTGGNGFVNAENGYFLQNLTAANSFISSIQAGYQPTNDNFIYTSSLNIYPGVTTSSINLSTIASINPGQLISVQPGIRCSTITVSSLVFGASAVDNLSVVNTLTVGSNTTSASISTNNIKVSTMRVVAGADVGGSLNVNGAFTYFTQTGDTINTRVFNAIQSVGTTTLTTGTANIIDANVSTLTANKSIVSLSSITTTDLTVTRINSIPYPPPGVTQPTGSMMIWPGGGLSGPTNVPAGYLYCDGAFYPTATYPNLYAAIGNTWGGDATNFYVPDTRGRAPYGALSQAITDDVTVTFQSINVTGPGINTGDRQNGWYVTAASGIVRPGMVFDFQTGGIIGSVRKILGTFDGQGDGWNLPFVIVWQPTATAPPTVFPTYAAGTILSIIQVANTTVGPWCGATTTNAGVFTPRASLGSAAIIQGNDQVAKHDHGFGQGGVQAAAGSAWRAGDPNTGGPTTAQNNTLYGYTYNAVGYAVPAAMPYTPPNFGIFYFIKT